MSAQDSNKLERMFERRFSSPVKHRLLEAVYGYPKFRKQIPGYLRASEGAILRYWASQLSSDSVILEIGTFNGLSAAYLCKGAEKSNSVVYSIDPFDSQMPLQTTDSDGSDYLGQKVTKRQVIENLVNAGISESRFKLLTGFSSQIVSIWGREIDFLWIDGNHKQALLDYKTWRKYLRRGSRVAFHDAAPNYSSFPEVIRDVRQIVREEKIGQLEKVKSIVGFVLEN